jgi:uncharacterized protein
MERSNDVYRRAEKLFQEKNFSEAFRLYKQLAAEGDPDCQVFLGWMYYQGLGVERSVDDALRWFEGAARLGSKVAAFYCGKHALIGARYEEAFGWLHASAAQDYGPSLLWLGLAHIRGLGVRADCKRGVGYLQRAAATGNFPARRELAVLMIRGRLGIAKIPLGLLLFPYAILSALVTGVWTGMSDKLMG